MCRLRMNHTFGMHYKLTIQNDYNNNYFFRIGRYWLGKINFYLTRFQYSKLASKMSMALEVKNHSDPPAGPSNWVFSRPEWISIWKKKLFSSKVLILYIVRTLIKNWANINKRVGPENGLVKSYNCSKILKIRSILGYETYNKSDFYEETFSLNYSDLVFPLFVLICLHRKNLFSRYSKNWNQFILSYNLPNTIYILYYNFKH